MLNKIKTEDLLRINNGDLHECIESNMVELLNEVRKKEVYLSYLLSETELSKGHQKMLKKTLEQLESIKHILYDAAFRVVSWGDYETIYK